MDSSHETSRPHETTEILTQISQGDLDHMDRLIDVVYDELRRIATRHISRENPGHTLQPTALVHEAFIKLVNQRDVDWKGRAHFLAVAAESMRRILVDHARGRSREKRGGGRQRISLREELTVSNRNDEDVLAVDEALTKLAAVDPVQAKIVDLRFFAGMTISEIAEVLNVSKRTVERNWTMIKAWLRRELASEPDE